MDAGRGLPGLDPERIAAISRWFERSGHHRNSMTDAFPHPEKGRSLRR